MLALARLGLTCTRCCMCSMPCRCVPSLASSRCRMALFCRATAEVPLMPRHCVNQRHVGKRRAVAWVGQPHSSQ